MAIRTNYFCTNVSATKLLFNVRFLADKVVCYWGTWSTYRWGNGKFTVDNIDPNLCTHLIYGFVGLQADGSVRLLDSYLDVDASKTLFQFFFTVFNPR